MRVRLGFLLVVLALTASACVSSPTAASVDGVEARLDGSGMMGGG